MARNGFNSEILLSKYWAKFQVQEIGFVRVVRQFWAKERKGKTFYL
jgi:hypothetical protein